MVYLLTDLGEYRALACPGESTIGRSPDNTFCPESLSVSKIHARIRTNKLGDKIDMWIEDLNSRNGTYVGESPLDLEKVQGQRKLQFGDYIRFGHSQKFFRVLDKLPEDEQAIPPPELITSGTFKDNIPQMESLNNLNVDKGYDYGLGETSFAASVSNLNNSYQSSLKNYSMPSNESRYQNSLNDSALDDAYWSPSHTSNSPIKNVDFNDDIWNKMKKELDERDSFALQAAGIETHDNNSQLDSTINKFKSKKKAKFQKIRPFEPYDHLECHPDLVSKYLVKLNEWRELLRDAGSLGPDLPSRLADAIISRAKKTSKASIYLKNNENKKNQNDDEEEYDPKKSQELLIKAISALKQTEKEDLWLEFLAEGLPGGGGGCLNHLGAAMTRLSDLLIACSIAASASVDDNINDSPELEVALRQEMSMALTEASRDLDHARSSQVLSILKLHSDTIPILDITRIMDCSMNCLVGLTSMAVSSSSNSPEASLHRVETATLCLCASLEMLAGVYGRLLSLAAEASVACVHHVCKATGRNDELAVLGELRELALTGDAAATRNFLNTLRLKEAAVLGAKFQKLESIFKIMCDHYMRINLRRWYATVQVLRRYDLDLFDRMESLKLTRKRKLFIEWVNKMRRKKELKKILYRFTRSLKFHYFTILRKAFNIIKERTARNSNYHPSLSQLRLEVLKLQSELESLSNSDKNVTLLAAERALNKSLLATNNELRQAIKDSELKVLELTNLPVAKRHDLVYRHLLEKEEQLASCRKTINIYEAELEQLRNIIHYKAKQAAGEHHIPPNLPASVPTQNSYPKMSIQPPMYQSSKLPNLFSGGNHYGNAVTPDHGLAKIEARHIILNEVRRLRASLTDLQNQRDYLNGRVTEELEKYTSLSKANQSLEERLIDLERSAAALRELLKQRLGPQGLLDISDALNSMGAGTAAIIPYAKPPKTETVIDEKTGEPQRNLGDIRYKSSIEQAFYPRF